MGLTKKTETVAVAETPKAESGTQAAIERLKTAAPKTETVKAVEKVQYKQRDYDQEARGKVRCVMFEAALQSPALAGLQFNSIEEFLVLCAKAADHGVAYTWKD